MSSIADITLDLVDFVYYGRADPRSNGSYFPNNPSSGDGSRGYFWAPWKLAGIANYDQPTDLYVSFDCTGTNPSLYKMVYIVYNLQVYTSTDDFRAAWASGKMIKSPKPSRDDSILRKDRRGPLRELETRMSPVVLALDGNRYKVDTANNYVEYLGWSFYNRFDRDVGIQFYDIKFKGERILYELALQGA